MVLDRISKNGDESNGGEIGEPVEVLQSAVHRFTNSLMGLA
jgi:hypothetical protein